MKKLAALILTIGLVVCFVVSCEQTTITPTMDPDVISKLTEIPMEYGSLESVTEVAKYPGWFQLWFEDKEGTIRMVRIQVIDNLIHNQVDIIPRSHPAREEVVEDEG